jgi:UDP-N-acetylmuramoylalanine-D-glutamate ligase
VLKTGGATLLPFRLRPERGIPVETDLSIFLGLCPGPILAVTGSKGKSTTATALARCLQTRHPGFRLGGNITVSPLGFLADLGPEDPVVLELSSWQLSDLREGGLLAPRISLVTSILPDHQTSTGHGQLRCDKGCSSPPRNRSSRCSTPTTPGNAIS